IVRLTKVANKKVQAYSLGMKQRLGIAASLLHSPEILILDEPTNGLDPSGIIEIRNLIKSLSREENMTILISSHLLSEIDQIATSVGIISNGSLIFQDSIETMRKLAKQKVKLKVSDYDKAWQTLIARGINVEKKDGFLYSL